LRTIILTNFDLCTGCQICQLTCSELTTGAYNPRQALLEVLVSQDGLVHRPVVCQQCQNAYCQAVCPAGAVSLWDTIGAVVIDPDVCTGCGLCARYCPLGVIRVEPGRGARKCHLCGGDPACVKACPTGALEKVVVGRDI
jgi:Fe-S-cluster-containing dehydrogenase component